MKQIKAIKIDAVAKTITEISIERSLESYYNEIGCNLVEFASIDRNNDLIIDEEGAYKENAPTFKINGYIIFGKALVVGINESGETVNTTLTLESIKPQISFD